MRTAVTLCPHRVSLSKSHCICHKILVQSQCGVHIADKWDTKGAKVSPQAELVCTLEEERLFSDMHSKQQQIGWHFTTGETDSGRGALEEGGEARTDVGTTSAFQLDISQRWTTYKLPTAVTDGQPWVCSHHQDSFLKSSHHHLTCVYLQVPPQSDIFLQSLPH